MVCSPDSVMFAVVAQATAVFGCRPTATLSTYALLAASVDPVGVGTIGDDENVHTPDTDGVPRIAPLIVGPDMLGLVSVLLVNVEVEVSVGTATPEAVMVPSSLTLNSSVPPEPLTAVLLATRKNLLVSLLSQSIWISTLAVVRMARPNDASKRTALAPVLKPMYLSPVPPIVMWSEKTGVEL